MSRTSSNRRVCELTTEESGTAMCPGPGSTVAKRMASFDRRKGEEGMSEAGKCPVNLSTETSTRVGKRWLVRSKE